MKKRLVVLLVIMSFVFTGCATKEEKLGEEISVEEKNEDPGEYTKGILTENGWESKWIGIRYEAPKGITMRTEEELNAVMGFSEETLSGDFGEAQIKYALVNTVYEMMCVAEDQITNISIAVEKLPREMDVDTYVAFLEESLSQITSMTYEVIDDEETIEIGGKEFRKIHCELSYGDLVLYQDYNVSVIGDRAVSISLAYTQEEDAENILSGFKVY